MIRPRVRRASRAWLALGVLGGLASRVPAPVRAQALPGSCTPDTATKVQQLLVGLEPDAGLPDSAAAMAAQLARQIASFVEPPARVSIDKLRGPSEWADGPAKHKSGGLLSIGQLVIVLGPDGRVRQAGLDPGTGSPEVDRALIAGVAAADSGGVFSQGSASSIDRRFRLWILTAPAPATSWATPVFRVAGRVPAAATPATVVAEVPPAYPDGLLGTGRTGEVYLAFDVDEAGGIPDGSLRVLSTDDPAFVAPAWTAIRAGHYTAGTQGGCPVRMTLRQRIRFHPAAGAGEATASGPTGAVSIPLERWIAESLPTYGRISALLEVENLSAGAGFSGMLGGTDVVQAHVRLVRAGLRGCTLTYTERVELEPSSPGTTLEVGNTVPLDHADGRSLRVERRPPQSSTRSATLDGNAWHVLLAMRDGAVRVEYRQGGRGAGSASDGWLDLAVPDPRSGAMVVRVLDQVMHECVPDKKS